MLDAITSLQMRVAEHIRDVLQNEESQASIPRFCNSATRTDHLSGRISDAVDDETFLKITGFLEERIRSAVHSKAFEDKVHDFISRRIDDLIQTESPIGTMFTDEAVALLKEKANDQMVPVAHHLTQIAAEQRTYDADRGLSLKKRSTTFTRTFRSLRKFLFRVKTC